MTPRIRCKVGGITYEYRCPRPEDREPGQASRYPGPSGSHYHEDRGPLRGYSDWADRYPAEAFAIFVAGFGLCVWMFLHWDLWGWLRAGCPH